MPTLPLENALHRRSFDDGWLDLLVGAGLAAIGVLWIFGAIVFAAAAPAILIPLWIAGRNSFIAPRMATARFRSGREEANRRAFGGWVLLGVGALVAVAVVAGMLRVSGAPVIANARDWAVALPNVLIGFGLLAGLALGARRFIVYAVLALALGAAGVLIGVGEPGYLIAAAGVPVLLCGAVMLGRFMRAHPLNGSDTRE